MAVKTRHTLSRLALAVAVGTSASHGIAADVVIGQVTPLSGLKAGDGNAYSAGMQMYFEHVNKKGGLNGNALVLARRDDAGRPEETVAVTQKLLMEQRPVALAGYIGSTNLVQLQQSGMLERERIALVGYRGATLGPTSAKMFNVRPDLREEIAKIARHLATVGNSRLGLLYEQGSEAQYLLAELDEALRREGAALVAKGSYPAGTMKIEEAKNALLKANPQAILLIASGSAAAGFIENYRLEGGKARIFATSQVDVEQLTKRLSDDQMQGVAIAQVVPNPYRIANRLTKEFREVYETSSVKAVPVSYAMMEGYITAKVIAEAVRRAGTRPTREGVLSALEGIENLDLGGHAVSYKGGKRSGSSFVELSIITSGGRIRQ